MRSPCGVFLLVTVLAACSSTPPHAPAPGANDSHPASRARPFSSRAQEVVVFALALIDTHYRFGGKNPEAGLDCSGMVSYVFEKAVDLRLTGSAAHLARLGQAVKKEHLRPGDLVFFGTQAQAPSHVGIYIGESRFVHAPGTGGAVRIARLDDAWFASRFTGARSHFD